MKTINYYMSFLAIFALLFTSCSKDEVSDVSGPDVQDTFQLQFGAILNDFEKQQTKDHLTTPVECRNADPSYVKIGLLDNSTGFFVGGPGDTNPFLIDVNIQDNNGSWETSFSEDLGLPAGSYSLEYFIVYSADDEVLWVAPRVGGAFAGDVITPLPQPITLVAGTKPYINVDVLCYEARVEEAFGYIFFDINLITVENSYCIFVNYCYNDGEDADGREYPAKFMVEVWGDDYDGDDVIIDGEMNTINPGPAATVLCLALPKILVGDTFFVRVTVMDDALLPYTSNGSDIFEFEISQADIDAQLDLTPRYRHVRINCGDDDGGNGNGGNDCTTAEGDCDGDTIKNKCDANDPNNVNYDTFDCDGDTILNGVDGCPNDVPGQGYVDADRDGCEDVVNPPVSCIPAISEGCERFSNSYSKTNEIQVIAIAIGDLTLEFTGDGLSVGLTPVAPFEFSDIEVTIGNTVVCIAEVVPDQGGTTVFAGLSAADLPISVGLKVNFCNISQ